MANLPESVSYDAGVYQLEATDLVQGGVSGKSNAPLKNLANRTSWLKAQVDALSSQTSMAAHVAASDPHPGYVTGAELVAAIAAIPGGIGVGQQYSSPVRASNTNYQNTSGKPILWIVAAGAGGGYGGYIRIGPNSSFALNLSLGFADNGTSFYFIVPPNYYYGLDAMGGDAATINTWKEMR